MNANSQSTLAIVALGYVDLPLAVEFGKHRPVVGFDMRADHIEELRERRDHTREFDASELSRRHI